MEDKKYLILFSIGPVQSFIAQARKTQDLYAGSQLLSDLAKQALAIAKREAKSFKPIFPNQDELKYYPNRFLAEFSHENPQGFGEEVKRKLRHFKEKIVNDVFLNIDKPEGFNAQIEDFLEIFWVVVDYNSDYKTAYKEAERLLGAIKNVRVFKQLNNGKGEVGRKCSVDGQYNVKFYRKTENDKDDNRLLEKKLFQSKEDVILLEQSIQKPFTLAQIQPGEGLSAMSMLKRLYKIDGNFPSTAGICLKHKLHDLEKMNSTNCLLNNLKSYTEQKIGHFDEQFYFKENHSKNYFKKFGINENDYFEIYKSFKFNYDKIETHIFGDKNQDNFKYYAILTFDGDSMGKWLSGENIRDAQLYNFHTELSEKLSDFASEASSLIQNEKGKTVYAGGDDFLAFVNLNYLWDVLDKLRERFKEKVNNPLKNKFGFNDKITFSAGIAIAHYKIPLKIVLGEARKMLEHAKDIDEKKDAFAITVLKHSGETPSTRMKWYSKDEKTLFRLHVDVSKELTAKLNSKNKVSNKFISDFHREFASLIDKNGEVGVEDEILKFELSRLAQRKVPKEQKEETKQFIENQLFLLYRNKEFLNFIQFLHICDFIARHTEAEIYDDKATEQQKELSHANA